MCLFCDGVSSISITKTIHAGGWHSLQRFIKNVFFVSDRNLEQIINVLCEFVSDQQQCLLKSGLLSFFRNTVFSFWSLLHSARAAPFWKCNFGRGRSEGNLKVECKVWKPVRRLEGQFLWLKTGRCHLRHRGCGPWKLLAVLHLHSSAVASSEPLISPGSALFRFRAPARYRQLLMMAGKTTEWRQCADIYTSHWF